MAEIRVERKKGRSLWPWILVLLVIAIAAWAVYTYGDRLGLHLHAASFPTPPATRAAAT